MLDFKPITLDIKDQYQNKSFNFSRSCLHTFATMFIWGQAKYVKINDYFVFLAKYGEKYVYPFPVGDGNIKEIVTLLEEDAKERNIPLRLSGLNHSDVEFLSENFPQKFEFIQKRDFEDYIYLLEDLKTLAGRKFHSKRNHLSKFKKLFPNYAVEEINENNLDKVWAFAEKWYNEKDDEDIIYEKNALKRAFDNYNQLGFSGLLLTVDDRVIAFTLGSQTTKDTFDIHFEKAEKSFDGAYAAINYFFANYISEKFPYITYLNREEDMGIDGLRKAKLSYNPVFLKERITAVEKQNDN